MGRGNVPGSPSGELCALAKEAGASTAEPTGSAEGGPAVLADRSDGTVVGLGAVVAKAHPPCTDTDADALTVRLRIAAHPRLAGILLPPLEADRKAAAKPARLPYASAELEPRRLPGGRLASLWPRGAPVAPDAPETAPWEAAGTLLARLHSVPSGNLADALRRPLPPMRGPSKALRAMLRMRTAVADGTPLAPGLAEAADAAEGAWATLPDWCRAGAPATASAPGILCHGDFHLGQLVRHPAPDGPWQLIDVDDLGLGDPAWDLARPAAWYAAGLLPAQTWNSFLRAYQTAAGTSAHDPWPRLDAPARALTAQTAALAVAKAHTAERPLDEAELACVRACARIAAAEGSSRSAGRSRPQA